LETVIGAGRGRCGVVRGCLLETGQDRCEWHASGTTVEDDSGIRLRRCLHLDRGLESVYYRIAQPFVGSPGSRMSSQHQYCPS
jgi:hypothetical protein